MKQRVEAYSVSPQPEIIISTALLWAIPEWAAACSQMQAFAKQYCEGAEGEGVNLGMLKEVWEELDLRARCRVEEGNIEELLQVPFFFLEQLMVKGLELTSCLEERLRRQKAELGDFTKES